MGYRVFIHGLDSSSQGTKGQYFKSRYPDMIIPDFEGSLQERMTRLEEVLEGKSGLTLVGSSFGGLMAVIFAMGKESAVERLVLLAPAIHALEEVPYPLKTLSIPVTIYHGILDEVIPLDQVKAVAERFFPALDFHEVQDDHFLHQTFRTLDWDRLLVG